MPVRLFIAGASARAAAQSAVRSGLQVTAADAFGDDDLAECCEARLVADYPQGILDIAGQIPPAEWMYTGGLENEPQLVDAVSQRHALLGHAAYVLRQVRDPWQLAAVLTRHKLLFPRPQRQRPDVGAGRWLLKPRRSCGGMRIRRFDPQAAAGLPASIPVDPVFLDDREDAAAEFCAAACPHGWYFQPWIRGASLSAVFLAARGSAALLGVTRQLVGCRWAGAAGFRYVGSVGPLVIDSGTRRQFQRIGDCLADAFRLCGLFGVDTIMSGTDVWTIEVNPRLTASVEVLERATGLAAVGLHRDVCRGAPLPAPEVGESGQWCGKAVIWTAKDCVMDDVFYQRLKTFPPFDQLGRFADLPRRGVRIPAGHPVLTTFAYGHSLGAVHRELRSHARVIRQMLGAHGSSTDPALGPSSLHTRAEHRSSSTGRA